MGYLYRSDNAHHYNQTIKLDYQGFIYQQLLNVNNVTKLMRGKHRTIDLSGKI